MFKNIIIGVLTVGLVVSLGFNFTKESKVVEKSNDSKEAGSVSMLNLIDNK